jgi:hypothetical protein
MVSYFEYMPNEVNTLILSKISDEKTFDNMSGAYPFNQNVYKEIITQEYPNFYSFIMANNGIINKELYNIFRFDRDKKLISISSGIIDDDLKRIEKLRENRSANNLNFVEGSNISGVVIILNQKLKEKNLVLSYMFYSRYNDIYQIIKNDSSFWDYREYILGILSNEPSIKYYENYSNHLYDNIIQNNGIFNIDTLLFENIKNIVNMNIKYNKKYNQYIIGFMFSISNVPLIIYLKLKQYVDINNMMLNNIFKYNLNKIGNKWYEDIIHSEINHINTFSEMIYLKKNNRVESGITQEAFNATLYQTVYPHIRSLKNINNSSYEVYIKIIDIFINEYGFNMDDIISEIY